MVIYYKLRDSPLSNFSLKMVYVPQNMKSEISADTVKLKDVLLDMKLLKDLKADISTVLSIALSREMTKT